MAGHKPFFVAPRGHRSQPKAGRWPGDVRRQGRGLPEALPSSGAGSVRLVPVQRRARVDGQRGTFIDSAGSAAFPSPGGWTGIARSASASAASKISSSCTCSSMRMWFSPALGQRCVHADHGAADDVGGRALGSGH